jgi:hypothetical protein
MVDVMHLAVVKAGIFLGSTFMSAMLAVIGIAARTRRSNAHAA